MKKVLLALLLCLVFSTTVSAHSTLENSTPFDGELIQKELTEINMQFNTSIENASIFTLTDANGGEIPVDVSVNDNTLSGMTDSPLQNGKYTVDWNIVGADGHPITGSYSFTVELPESQENNSTESTSSKSDEESTENETAETVTDTTTEAGDLENDADEDSTNSFMTIGIIALVVIILLTMFSLVRRNKK